MDRSIPLDTNDGQARWERVRQWPRLHTSRYGCSIAASAYEEPRKIIVTEAPTTEEAPHAADEP
jgi:hypothetical protein